MLQQAPEDPNILIYATILSFVAKTIILLLPFILVANNSFFFNISLTNTTSFSF